MNVLDEHDALFEMTVGSSKSACRGRFQTTVSCFGTKVRDCEHYVKSHRITAVCMVREANASEPLMRYRKIAWRHQNRGRPLPKIGMVDNIPTGHVVSGVQAA